MATADLAAGLAGHLISEIIVRGSQGGPLEPLAAQLNHDLTHVQGTRLERLLMDVREALIGVSSGQAPLPAMHSLARTRELGQAAARELMSRYRRGLHEFYQHGLHELVALPLIRDGAPVGPHGLADAVREAGHVQLTGPSGCGKTHLVRHARRWRSSSASSARRSSVAGLLVG